MPFSTQSLVTTAGVPLPVAHGMALVTRCDCCLPGVWSYVCLSVCRSTPPRSLPPYLDDRLDGVDGGVLHCPIDCNLGGVHAGAQSHLGRVLYHTYTQEVETMSCNGRTPFLLHCFLFLSPPPSMGRHLQP